MQTKTKSTLTVLTECSIMIALTTVLSIIKLFELPYGGSITVASMLPIAIISYRHGIKVGVGAAFAASVLQLLLGLNNLSYFTTWYSIVAIIMLDYFLAFTAFGLCGVFKGTMKNGALSMLFGTLVASVLRYACHVISGATVWAGLSIPTGAALVYSFGYNATYMIPETVVLLLAVFYIGASLDLTKRIPTPILRKNLNTGATILSLSAGFVLLCALVTDTVLVFSKLQNPDAGEFMISGLADVNWLLVGIVSAAAAVVFTALVLVARALNKSKN